MKGNFAAAWEELGEENELEDTYSLPFKTLDEAVKNIVMYLGLQPCERSDKVPEGKSSHTLLLSGVFRYSYECIHLFLFVIAIYVTNNCNYSSVVELQQILSFDFYLSYISNHNFSSV